MGAFFCLMNLIILFWNWSIQSPSPQDARYLQGKTTHVIMLTWLKAELNSELEIRRKSRRGAEPTPSLPVSRENSARVWGCTWPGRGRWDLQREHKNSVPCKGGKWIAHLFQSWSASLRFHQTGCSVALIRKLENHLPHFGHCLCYLPHVKMGLEEAACFALWGRSRVERGAVISQCCPGPA